MKELEEIVKSSIYDVICIDDDYVSPYPKGSKMSKGEIEVYNKKNALSRKMYYDLGKGGNSITLEPFESNTQEEILLKKLSKKDLLVLDWELTQPAHSKHPLRILEAAVACKVKYICIYTKIPDLQSVKEAIKLYYEYDQENLEKTLEAARKTRIMKAVFQKHVEKYHMSSDKNLTEIKEVLKSENIEYDRSVFNADNPRTWETLYYAWENQITVPEKKLNREVKIFEKVILIDDTYILVFNKKGGTNKGVTEADIIPKISKTLVSEPNSILNGIWLAYTNLIEESLDRGGNYFKDLNWKAFAFYAYRLAEGYSDQEMISFLSEIFMKRISQEVITKDNVLPESIINKLKKEGGKQRINKKNMQDYCKLNSFLNTNVALSETKHNLTFGDVLKGGNGDYYMCISAKCECAKRANGKENHDFFLIRGTSNNDVKLFNDIERENYSFIGVKKGKQYDYKAVHWGEKIASFHTSAPEVSVSSSIQGELNGLHEELEYICNIADEYSQRMANAAYSFENRVGVSFANSYKSEI